MFQNLYDDAERSRQIATLGQTIASMQPSKVAAESALAAAKRTEDERRVPLASLEKQLAGIGAQVHFECNGVYLDCQALDRGKVMVGNDQVRFEGWRGNTAVALGAITGFDTGISNLPVRAGVPVLGKLWPGTSRKADTLRLTIRQSDATQRSPGKQRRPGHWDPGQKMQQVVLADLPDGSSLQAEVKNRISKLATVGALRAGLTAQRQAAADELAVASLATAQAKAKVDEVEAEIASYRRQRAIVIEQQRVVDARRRAAEKVLAAEAAARKAGK